MTCLGVQLDELQHVEDLGPEQDAEEPEEEPRSSPKPTFELASNVVNTSPPVAPSKRTTTTRKTDNDIILITDQVPTAPPPPHATTRLIKPTIVARSAVKTATKKLKTTK